MIRLRGLLAQAEWERGRFEEAEAQLAAGFAVGAVGEAGEAELAELHNIRLQFLSRMSEPGGMTDVLAALPR